jgi:hypothetical protein
MGTDGIAGTSALFNPGSYWAVAGTGDFNGDGAADILWGGQGGEVVTWRMGADGIAGTRALFNPGGYWQVIA